MVYWIVQWQATNTRVDLFDLGVLIKEIHLDYNEEDQKLQVKTNQYN